jgi:hypothetical protein
MQVNNSEIARLRQQIELECQAMQLGLSGYAHVAKHQTITNKYNTLGKHQEQLEALVGEEQAALITAEIYMKVMG